MPIAWKKHETGGEAGRKGVEKGMKYFTEVEIEADEIVSNDGFVVVATKQKPRPAEPVNADPKDDLRSSSNRPTITTLPAFAHHPISSSKLGMEFCFGSRYPFWPIIHPNSP
jgi:hypothetical protein